MVKLKIEFVLCVACSLQQNTAALDFHTRCLEKGALFLKLKHFYFQNKIRFSECPCFHAMSLLLSLFSWKMWLLRRHRQRQSHHYSRRKTEAYESLAFVSFLFKIPAQKVLNQAVICESERACHICLGKRFPRLGPGL